MFSCVYHSHFLLGSGAFRHSSGKFSRPSTRVCSGILENPMLSLVSANPMIFFLYKYLCVSGVESTSKHAVHTKTPWRWMEYDGIINWFGIDYWPAKTSSIPFSSISCSIFTGKSWKSPCPSCPKPRVGIKVFCFAWPHVSWHVIDLEPVPYLIFPPQPWYPRKYGRTIPLNGLCWGYLRCFKWLVWLP